ncbi:MAG: efflux RND transporter permease subunit [Bacteroidales bacterium]|nr:efflux RND transporter permease subunit [Bacteroidales bacterium]
MKLPELSVKRPVATAMIFIAVLLFGLVSLQKLPIDIMPKMELPTITVITVYPGASAEEVEQQVTKPLEAILSSTENLKEINSSSKENVSFVSLQFNWGADINEASNNARDLIELIKRHLPADAQSPVIFKINSSMMPILVYGITAKENYTGIEQIIEDKIASPVRKVDGVGTVIYLSQPTREIKVNVNPNKLQAYNMSISQISTILKAENITIPGGNIKVGKNDFAVRVPGEFTNVNDIRNIVLINFNGKIIRLKDVSDVEDSFKEKDEFVRTKNGLGVAFLVQKQSGANTLDVIKATRKKMAEIKKKLPKDVEIFEIMNTDEVITQSIGSLSSSIWWALLFVSLVVFLFLREWKSSLIIFLTIPFSLITAFITMYLIGYTINIFSLMALVIAIGMVVDNAIVVLENITQHIDKGSKPKMAAIFGTSEMGMAISASTATTLMVFIPMVFMGGIVGIMFKQLAILTSVTMLASLFTALTLTPMISSKLLKPRGKQKKKHAKLYEAGEKIFRAFEAQYKKVLNWAIFHKTITISAAVLVFAFSLYVGKHLGTDYIPEFDAGDLAVVFETPVGTSAVETDRVSQKVQKIIKENVPEKVQGTLLSISGQTEDGSLTTVGFSEGKNVSTVLCHLTLPNKRKRTAKEIGEAVRKKVAEIPEIEKFNVTSGSLLSAALLGNKKPIEVNISGNDFDDLIRVATQIKNKFEKTPGLTDITTTIDNGKLEIQISIDKEKASSMALNTAMIAMQVRQSIFGANAGEYKEKGNNYDIVVRYAPEHRNNIEDIKNITVTNLRGKQIPLSSFATITEGTGSLEIKRNSQQRIVSVQAGLNKISLGEATIIVKKIISSIDTPSDVDVELGGQVTSQGESFDDLYLILILGVLLVYMVMAAQFESFLDPFIIMFAVPFALIGVVWAFKVTSTTLSITTFIGIIMLIGIVVNNAIVLVDYTNLLRQRNYKLMDAVLEAGKSRMRPVLMTSLTTMLGMLPMAVSSGMGKEMFAPLGITMIGGLLISTLITLLLVPTIYTAFHYKSVIKERNEQALISNI